MESGRTPEENITEKDLEAVVKVSYSFCSDKTMNALMPKNVRNFHILFLADRMNVDYIFGQKHCTNEPLYIQFTLYVCTSSPSLRGYIVFPSLSPCLYVHVCVNTYPLYLSYLCINSCSSSSQMRTIQTKEHRPPPRKVLNSQCYDVIMMSCYDVIIT